MRRTPAGAAVLLLVGLAAHAQEEGEPFEREGRFEKTGVFVQLGKDLLFESDDGELVPVEWRKAPKGILGIPTKVVGIRKGDGTPSVVLNETIASDWILDWRRTRKLFSKTSVGKELMEEFNALDQLYKGTFAGGPKGKTPGRRAGGGTRRSFP